MFHVSIYKKETESAWSATPSNALVQRLHTHFPEGSMRWIAVLRVSGEEHRIALGSPMEGTELSMHLPEWYIESIGIFGHGEELIVSFEKSEGMTRATSLKFRTLDPVPDWLDIRDVLEEPLSQLGILKQGQILPIPVLESAVIIVEVCEPSDVPFVFLDGENIAMEVDTVQEEEHIQEEEQEQEQIQEQPQVPFEEVQMPVNTPPTRGFVPFSGKGHVLGTGRVIWGP